MPRVPKQQAFFEDWLRLMNFPVELYATGVINCSVYLREKLKIRYDFYRDVSCFNVHRYAAILFKDTSLESNLKTALEHYCEFVKKIEEQNYNVHLLMQMLKMEKATMKMWQAFKDNDIEALDTAISEGANFDSCDAEQKTLLHHTAGNEKYIRVLKRMIWGPANIYAVDVYGNTPLHYAVLSKNITAARTLLKAGAKLDIANNKGETVLDLDNGNDELIKEIVQAGSILHHTLKKGKGDISKAVQLLIYNGVDVNLKNSNGCTPLHYAAAFKSDIITELINYGADLNAVDNDGKTPLMYAFSEMNDKSIMMLLKAGAVINEGSGNGKNGSYEFYPLHYAADFRNKELISFLLKKGVDINMKDQDGCAPIHLVNGEGWMDDEIISMVYEAGADINSSDLYGETPLHKVSKNGSLKAINALLTLGASVHAADASGETALHKAAHENPREEVTESLLCAGAQVNVQDEAGNTPLHEAAYNKNFKIAELLLQAGADVNIQNVDGNTPLHIANRWFREEHISLLLKYGAAEDILNSDGKTPHQEKNEGMKKFLEFL